MNKKQILIGISGKAGSGKSHAADLLWRHINAIDSSTRVFRTQRFCVNHAIHLDIISILSSTKCFFLRINAV